MTTDESRCGMMRPCKKTLRQSLVRDFHHVARLINLPFMGEAEFLYKDFHDSHPFALIKAQSSAHVGASRKRLYIVSDISCVSLLPL